MSTKQQAQKLVHKAVKENVLSIPNNCELCNRQDGFPLIAHHYCYDYPLKVLWICKSCHKLIHLNNLDTWSNSFSIRDALLKKNKNFKKNYKKYNE